MNAKFSNIQLDFNSILITLQKISLTVLLTLIYHFQIISQITIDIDSLPNQIRFEGTLSHIENINASNVSICSQENINILRNIKFNALGIRVENSNGENIGHSPAYRGWLGKNWYPLMTTKQTACGILDRFGIHDGGGDEVDWNIFFLPENEDLLNVAEVWNDGFDAGEGIKHNIPPIFGVGGTSQNWYYDNQGNILFEAETTPHQNHRHNNNWFPPDGSWTILANRDVCFYGPFVREEGHGNRPEIHPSEVIWWKDNNESIYFILLQDASHRYNKLENFGYGNKNLSNGQNIFVEPPEGWNPWVIESGQEYEILIPFEVNPNNKILVYNLAINEAFSINNEARHSDSDNGNEHAIEYNGKIVLSIQEPFNVSDEQIGITFENICYNQNEELLQGFIKIKCTLGNGNGQEGYLEMRLDKTELNQQEKLVHQWQRSWDMKYWVKLYNDENKTSFQNIYLGDFKGQGISDELIDFNGNGKTDVLRKDGNDYYVSYDGTSDWEYLNNINHPFEDLRFGFFDEDNRTDIFYKQGRTWYAIYNGNTTRQKLNSSKYDLKYLAFQDMNGDGKTDVLRIRKGKKFRFIISYSGTGNWTNEFKPNFPWVYGSWNQGYTNQNFSKFDMDDLRFADFNGDGKTDILVKYFCDGNRAKSREKNCWWVSWGGQSDWDKLREDSKNIPIGRLLFENFNWGNRSDIAYIDKISNRIYASIGGRTDWQEIGALFELDPITTKFGDFDGNGSVEAFQVKTKKVSKIPTIAATPILNPTNNLNTNLDWEYVPNTLQRKKINGENVLTMDINVKLHDLKISDSDKQTRKYQKNIKIEKLKNLSNHKSIRKGCIKYKNKSDKSELFVKSIYVPQFDNHLYQFDFKNGKSSKLKIPAFGITTVEKKKKVTKSANADDDWGKVLKLIEKEKFDLNQFGVSKNLKKIKEIQIEVSPLYAPIKEKKIAIAEDSPITDELNFHIQHNNNNNKRMKKIFGKKKPFKIQWTFKAIDIESGKTINVKENKRARKNQFRVQVDSKSKQFINISFPKNSDGKIYLIVATATIIDTFNNKSEIDYPIFSHYISMDENHINFSDSSLFHQKLRYYLKDKMVDLKEFESLIRIREMN